MPDVSTSALILVVDDEPAIRELLVRWLEPAGYRTHQAAHSEAALEAVVSVNPAVVLCDVEMPGPDGLWLVRQLRDQHPQIGIVLATAQEAVRPAVTLQPGVVGYVVKPFKRQQLLDVVKQAVNWHNTALLQEAQPNTVDPIDEWLAGNPSRD